MMAAVEAAVAKVELEGTKLCMSRPIDCYLALRDIVRCLANVVCFIRFIAVDEKPAVFHRNSFKVNAQSAHSDNVRHHLLPWV